MHTCCCCFLVWPQAVSLQNCWHYIAIYMVGVSTAGVESGGWERSLQGRDWFALSQMWHLAEAICCESRQIKENRASHALEISVAKRGRAVEPDVPSRLCRSPKSCLRHGSREGRKVLVRAQLRFGLSFRHVRVIYWGDQCKRRK